MANDNINIAHTFQMNGGTCGVNNSNSEDLHVQFHVWQYACMLQTFIGM